MKTTASRITLALMLSASVTQAQDEQYEALGRKLERAILDGNARAYDVQFDADALLDRALEGIEAPNVQKSGYRRGFKSSFGFGANIIGQIGEGSYAFLRVREIDGMPRAIFRVLLGNGSVNYQELCLESRRGRVRVVDIYTAVNGELSSEILRRHFLMTLASTQRGKLSRLFGKDNTFMDHLPAIEKMADRFKAGHYRSVLDIYASLPAKLQKERVFLAMRVNAAMLTDDTEYRAALDDYEKWIPADDPSRALMMVDAYLMRGEYDKMVASLDVLSRRIGDDGYLEMMKCSAMLEKGDVAKARRYADRAVQLEPDMFDCLVVSLRCSLLDRKHDDSKRLLDRMTQNWELEDDGLRELEGFSEFVRSNSGRKWDAARKAAARPSRPIK